MGVPYNGDDSLLGSILGSPILGNYHIGDVIEAVMEKRMETTIVDCCCGFWYQGHPRRDVVTTMLLSPLVSRIRHALLMQCILSGELQWDHVGVVAKRGLSS